MAAGAAALQFEGGRIEGLKCTACSDVFFKPLKLRLMEDADVLRLRTAALPGQTATCSDSFDVPSSDVPFDPLKANGLMPAGRRPLTAIP